MAEIIVKVGSVGPDPSWQDGDVIAAISRRRIREVHANHIFHADLPLRRGQRLPKSHRSFQCRLVTCRYRFERQTKAVVKRIDQTTGNAVLLSNKPQIVDGHPQQIYAQQYVSRRLQHEKHWIYGADGAEVWFGGAMDVSNPKLDDLWSYLETNGIAQEADYTEWPWGSEELKSHLAIDLDTDLTDSQAVALVQPVLDQTDPNNPVAVKARSRSVNWKAIPGLNQAAIQDPGRSVDVRKIRFPLASILTKS